MKIIYKEYFECVKEIDLNKFVFYSSKYKVCGEYIILVFTKEQLPGNFRLDFKGEELDFEFFKQEFFSGNKEFITKTAYYIENNKFRSFLKRNNLLRGLVKIRNHSDIEEIIDHKLKVLFNIKKWTKK